MDAPANQTRADQIKQAQAAVQAGRFADASALSGRLLASDPRDQDALYIAAVSARYSNQFETAAQHLQVLKQAAPEYGRAFQEDGHLRQAMGDRVAALIAYQLATRYNPALTASWQAQADLMRASGDVSGADQALAQLQRVKALPRELLAVTNHLHEGRILRAEEIARAFMRKNPQHIEGMRLLADIGSRLGVHEDADFLLETAIALEDRKSVV